MKKSIHSDDYQHFLSLLRDARIGAGLSQDQLAATLGEHQTFVSKVERGVRRLDVVELRLWVMALNRTAPEFCEQLDARIERHSQPPASLKRK